MRPTVETAGVSTLRLTGPEFNFLADHTKNKASRSLKWDGYKKDI